MKQTPSGARTYVFKDDAALASSCAAAFCEFGRSCIASFGQFTCALTGGQSPIPIYAELAGERYRRALDWDQAKIYWGDERAVGPESDESNYRLAYELWLRHAPIPEDRIFRMRGEAPDLAAEADRYSRLLEREVPAGRSGFPALDLILLGLGEDGHLASLFPDTRALDETLRIAVANEVPRLRTTRLTLTYPVLQAGKLVWFVVRDPKKGARAAQCLGLAPGGETLPAAVLRPESGELYWWLTQAVVDAMPGNAQRQLAA